jgi:hypothetical protein
MPQANAYNPYVLAVEILLAMGLLLYFFRKRRASNSEESAGPQRFELKLRDNFEPREARLKLGKHAQLIIHRFATEPADELFEIEELEIYELLPALHTTVIAVNPQKRGRFRMVLGGEREAGVLVVE